MARPKQNISKETVAAIDAQHELMRLAYENADAELLGNEFFTDDAWVVGGADMTWRNRSGMISLYRDIVGKYRWKNDRESIIQLSETVVSEFLIGTIVPVDESDETLPYKIQLIWTKTDGKWKCLSQFFGSGTDFALKQ
ncbi:MULTISPECIES: nuclear transport factor 2 family protein [unclassified Mesorhizobium]|uniref:nuclear transport factor 2 family protein n=1 Tax=unclassified Mesorhizobium TaxID=325217 RepID=UPI000FCC6D81|nr:MULTISPECIES: nuclear transport factor 2 family protein [unclassified Mesorhizobium]TGP21462.1 nuclear transport factor 2 family protein [Mesorhizobium sp. M1D.F.Ca.ET.231.01.1.1]TGP28908.1 nuclear transport factor 2 family protein [Mesorhizobium sp. M1D.F.Ca.ET.234.01.1.1]TGS43377.1 nuclear transport factor 2 family protein [Mesorhizobium sp. M1D.F.Ca.ET.184.01.1.1]TGS59924.1 nuclear transport factor 2 family protein [Mesorhizobium sp. M1D.F.Ca.ET.183.01.1.1]